MSETCTATLVPTSAREAEGRLDGHPGRLMVRTRRDGDQLHVEIRDGQRVVGEGVLVLDVGDDANNRPPWIGEIMIHGARWWCKSARGSGLLEFSGCRRPFTCSENAA